jgi:hypothetical protein
MKKHFFQFKLRLEHSALEQNSRRHPNKIGTGEKKLAAEENGMKAL